MPDAAQITRVRRHIGRSCILKAEIWHAACHDPGWGMHHPPQPVPGWGI